jgi:hypothetical protein
MLARKSSLWSGLFWVTLTFVLGDGQEAVAAKPPSASKAQARERQAKTACLSGDYLKGISILAELFVQTDNPVHLFNQGRCYEQNVHYVEAAERFREYLRKAGEIPADVRAKVDQHIADCDAAIARSQPRPAVEAVPAPAPVPVPRPEPVPPPSPPKAQQDDTAATAPAPIPPTTIEHPWQHTAKWVATGAALASLGLGVYQHLRYYSKNRDYNNDPKCYELGQCKGLAGAADTAHTWAIVGYSAGAVATGLAIWFWLTDEPRVVPAQHAGTSFTCAPALSGAVCGGRF